VTSIKIDKQRLLESVQRILEEKPPAESGAFPPQAPKNMPLKDGEAPPFEQVIAKFRELAPGAPNDMEKQLAQIGGEAVLKKNYELLAKQFAGAAGNPDRIMMPVVDPDKADADIGDDGGDLGRRMKKGELDLKPPYAKESIHRIAKRVVETLHQRGLLREQDPEAEPSTNLDTVFPQGLDKDKDAGEKFLTKGTRDGSSTDDSAVTLTKRTIPVGKSKPSQKQIYIDKSLWNILKFTGTQPGKTAHGDANMIAIADGGEYIILDGHHRWSSAFLSGGPAATINVQVIDGLNVEEAIAALRAYGNARGNIQKA